MSQKDQVDIKAIAQAADAKLRLLDTLLWEHRGERVLIFTSDNATVYTISRRFLIPAITHQTKVKERHETLRRFNDGEYPFLDLGPVNGLMVGETVIALGNPFGIGLTVTTGVVGGLDRTLRAPRPEAPPTRPGTRSPQASEPEKVTWLR